MGCLWRSTTSTTNVNVDRLGNTPTPRWRKVIGKANKWLGVSEENGEWLKDMRGNLSMVATIIATMTFQIGLNPPGGIVQNLDKGVVDCPKDVDDDTAHACPGESVYAAMYENQYNLFMSFNNASFFSSLIVCLFLVSGIPLNHRLPTWLLAIGMCISLISLAMTYVYGLYMVTPYALDNKSFLSSKKGVNTWFATLVGIVAFILVLRFVFTMVEILTKTSSKSMASTTKSDNIEAGNREWIIACENFT